MSRLSRAGALFGLALLGLTGCKGKGTFVVLSFTSGPALVKSIACTLTLGTQTASASYTATGEELSFPTTGTLEIGSGAGSMMADCAAKDAGGAVLATATGTLVIVRDATSTLTLAFSAEPNPDGGSTGALTIDPPLTSFGTKVVGDVSMPVVFTIKNSGPAITGALAVALLGADKGDFEITGNDCVGKTLAANLAESCTIAVRFSPKSAALAKNARLEVAAPAGTAGGSVNAPLSGIAGERGALTFSMANHGFPSQLVGGFTATSDATFTLTNGGNITTTSIAVTIDGSDAGSFTKLSDDCDGKPLAGGGTCAIKVRFSPTKRGALAASLSATATKGGTATVDLTGTGLVPATLVLLNGAPSNARFDFGTVDINTTSTLKHSFTLRNDGDFATSAIAFVTSPLMADIGPTVNTTCVTGMPLNPGQSCVGELAFTPLTFGIKNIDLTFTATQGGTVATYMTGVGRDQVTIIVGNAAGQTAEGTITDTAMPQNFNCGQGGTLCSKIFTRTTMPVSVSLVATPNMATYAQFGSWTQPASPACAMAGATCSLNLDATVAPGTYTYTANYTKQKFTVTYIRRDLDFLAAGFGGGGGLGALSSSNGFSCPQGPCVTTTELVNGGTSLVVSAAVRGVVGAGKSLRRFTSACGTGSTAYSADSTAATCNITVTANTTVNVTFSAHNYAFVTSGVYNGNLGGLAGSNMICQQLANAAKLPGTFVSVLSDSTTHARDRFSAGAQGWLRVDGLPFAEDSGSLFGQLGAAQAARNWRLYYPLSLDETGASHVSATDRTRTYSNADGTRQVDSNHCINWTSPNDAATTAQTHGLASSGSLGWIGGNGIGAACGSTMRLYCLGTDMNTPVPPPTLPSGTVKRIFLSSTKYTPAVGQSRNAMNDLCKTEGQTVFGAASSWKALAATTTSTAASQAAAGAYTFVRPDNVRVGSSAAVLGASPQLEASINEFADGKYQGAGGTEVYVSTGADNPTVNGNSNQTCGDWANPALANVGTAGFAYDTMSSYFSFAPAFACSAARRVYCVEQ